MSEASQPPSENTAEHCTDLAEYLRILHEPGDVFEVRILDCPDRPGGSWKSTAAGWFMDTDKAAREAERIEKLQPPAVYVTLNPVNPVLMGRSMNRISPKAKATTKDENILRRRWLFIDIDAIRPAGISSTDAELAEAVAVSDAIQAAMAADGWPEPLVGMSGNGRYLLWRIDLPNDTDSDKLIERALKALAHRFDSDGAEVDCSTFNASRICKLLGTMVRKGDELRDVPGVEDRPHRRSWFIAPPNPLQVVSAEQLQKLAEQFAEPEPPKANASGSSTGGDVLGRCCKYLEQMPPAISGELGHKRLFAAACIALHDFELSDSDATVAIERAYNPRCVPPWDRAGIDRAIKRARNKGGPSEAKQRRDAAKSQVDLSQFMVEPGESSPSGSSSESSESGPSSKPSPSNGSAIPWPDPQPLPEPLPEVMPYPSDLLPEAVGNVVDDIAERMQCPADFPAAAMLVAMAAVIGCRVGIRPRRFDDWLVVPNLWGCVVGRPSLKKSPAIATAEKRVRAIEARDAERLAEVMQSAGVDGLLAEARIKATKCRIDKAMKTGDEATARTLAQEIAEIEAQESPIPRRIITTDPTIEKLVELLNVHRFGMLLWVDELVGWMRSLDRDDKAGVRQQFLTLWNGHGRLNIDRIMRGETVCDSPCVSLFGCATPGGIGGYVAAAQRGGRGDDGLIQRLQILVWPDSPREFVHVDRWPNADARTRLAEVFEALADLTPEQFAERDQFDDGSGIPWVRFDTDGQAIFDRWETDIQRRLRAGDLPESIESHLAKYASMVPSIALVIHLAMGGRGPVSGSAASMAVRWAEYLESHAQRVYGVSVAPERRAAEPLLRRLIEWPEGKPIRVRAIREKCWANLTDGDVIKQALELLADHGWVRAVEVRPETGRPTTEYVLHPSAAKFCKSKRDRAPETIETPSQNTFVGSEGALHGVNETKSIPSARVQGVI